MKPILRSAGALVALTLFAAAFAPADATDSTSVTLAWLTRINMYRTLDELPPLANDPTLTAGAQAHAIYLIKNFAKRVRAGTSKSDEIGRESAKKPFYTDGGGAAAPHSEADFAFGAHQSQEEALDRWVEGPHHRMLLLNPDLERIGYGYYCERSLCAQVIDVEDGISKLPPDPSKQAAIEFPPANSTISLDRLTMEAPDPLTACPGYTYPVGLPITFQIGSFVGAKLGPYSIVRKDHPSAPPIEACGYDAFTYRNPARSHMATVIGGLKAYGAVVVIPRHPLPAGIYRATISVNDREYGWSFTIAPGESHASAR
jgi:hypothetical protein